MVLEAGDSVWVAAREPFDFRYVLAYFGRSDDEILDVVQQGAHRRVLLEPGETALIETVESLCDGVAGVRARVLSGRISEDELRGHLKRQYQLNGDRSFHRISDPLARELIDSFPGAPTVQAGSPYETLVWAIIGQQINIAFAHRLKRAFVEHFGERLYHNDRTYYAFPRVDVVAGLDHERDLLPLQFSRQKSRYIIGISRAILAGELDFDVIHQTEDEEALDTLRAHLGVGRWTAEYTLLRGLGRRDVIPAGDAGLKAALGVHYGLGRNATEHEVRTAAEAWRPNRGAIGFLIWLSLQYGWFHKAGTAKC
ncbi:MAG: DNA-3-methyladenine glycosylase family protein [Chloroflexota bacterium]